MRWRARHRGGPGRGMTSPPSDPAALLRAYDEQLRQETEVPSAITVDRLGPLLLASFLTLISMLIFVWALGLPLPMLGPWLNF